MPTLETASETPQRQAGFAPTNWNTVLAAGESDSVRAEEALATLCRTYWYPLYVYVRRKGHSVHDAEDLTQGFFEQLQGILSSDSATASYAEIGARLKMSEVAVKVAAHRLRQRYAELVRDIVAHTLPNPTESEVEREIRHLLEALSS